MKKFLIPMFLILLAWSCMPSQKAVSPDKKAVIKKDSTEYEITIIDPEFDQWYLLTYSPAKDYSNEYYRSHNRIAVSNWNDYFLKGKYHRVIDNYIIYDNSADYGIEVNRKLFWYFKYTEDRFRIRLLN